VGFSRSYDVLDVQAFGAKHYILNVVTRITSGAFPMGTVIATGEIYKTLWRHMTLNSYLIFACLLLLPTTLVLKPSERDPSLQHLIAHLFKEAGLPDGVFNVVNGDKDAVDTLVTDARVQAVSFVGSTWSWAWKRARISSSTDAA